MQIPLQSVIKMMSAISLKKKEEPLLPQVIETPPEDKAQVPNTTTSTTKTKKKKFLKSCMAGASSVFQLVLFLVLWLTPGRILTLLY